MAQTNYTPISLYYSATATNVPTAGNLVAGELALNTADGKLFYKDSAGVVQTLASKSTSSGVFTSVTDSGLTSGRVTYATTGGLLTDSASLQFNGTNLGVGAAPIGTVRQYIKGTGTTSSTFPLYIDDSAGTNIFTFTDAGNLGISTNSPSAKFSIKNPNVSGVQTVMTVLGATSAVDLFAMTANQTTDVVALGTNYAGNLAFNTNSTERMRITSAGGVSFGATGTAYGTSGQVLTSAGNAPPTWTTISSGGVSSLAAGTGISVSGSTGAVTVTNSGVTSLSAGTGISVSASTGGITITNSSPASGSAAKAWVNFSGVGSTSIRASFNVSSVTYNSTGNYTVNYTSAFADTSYSTSGICRRNAQNSDIKIALRGANDSGGTLYSTTQTAFTTTTGGFGFQDCDIICTQAWR